jgi:dephospho-CoA kinase
MNVLVAGPCGVGKSAASKLFAQKLGMRYFDFDEIGKQDMQKLKVQISPFSASRLNFMQSIPPIILHSTSTGFVLDIGGDTVFRKSADNNERLAQVMWLRETYATVVIVLTANKDVLKKRFVSTKNRSENEFDEVWRNWKDIAEQYWKKCGDIFIDTSFLTINETIGKIKTTIKDNANQYE